MRIGVLSLQGDFKEHMASLARNAIHAQEVRTKTDLKKVDALILPGGESTTIAKLLLSTGLDHDIRIRVEQGMPIWGTCAGAILLARDVSSTTPLDAHLSILDVSIERNSYGRQSESFVASLTLHNDKFSAFFIRAPRITRIGRGVRALLKVKSDPVLVRQKNILASTFHSEMTEDDPVLKYFLEMIGS